MAITQKSCQNITPEDLATIDGIINLSKSVISTLKAGDFTGLTNLKMLYLSENYIRNLPAGIFNEMTSLKTLALTGNLLDSLHANQFNNLSNLKHLGLEGNKLTTLPLSLFEGLSNVRLILLYGNEIASLPEGILGEDLISLENLSLGHNKLSQTEIDQITSEFIDLVGTTNGLHINNQDP